MQADGDWWRGGVIYQIYPRSFQDDNGDGVGDLAGITRRLDYVADLGVDAIWLSPFYPSPMDDFGYDVSDYRGVDPLFGTMDDFDQLVAKAGKLGLKVIVDLVISHTSSKHPWFADSCSGADSPKANWYVWADPKPDGCAPNNWLSIFGGSAWQWHPTRCQYYLHNFLASQPDLNFHEPQVQDELLDTARFWLRRGVSGFRLDTVNFYFHDPLLRDNPALAPSRRSTTIAPLTNPYSHQEHLYDRNRPENLAFLEKLRAVTNEQAGSVMIGEVGDALRGLELVGEYTQQHKRLHMCYSFELLAPVLTAATASKIMTDVAAAAPDGWPCWALSNHDVQRHITRLAPSGAPNIDQGKMLIALLLALRGGICLYQGEELGLPEARLAFEDLQDPYGIEFWPEKAGRDGCRTPMAWEQSAKNFGFSDAKPWLPSDLRHGALAVNAQLGQSAGMLSHYRNMLKLRRENACLRTGSLQLAGAQNDQVLSFWRGEGRQMLCCFNFAGRQASAQLDAGGLELVATSDEPASLSSGRIILPAYGYCWARHN